MILLQRVLIQLTASQNFLIITILENKEFKRIGVI